MNKQLLLILTASAALSCGRQAAGPVVAPEYSLQQAADSIPLFLGKDVRVGDVWMSLNDVPSDSRCPRGAPARWMPITASISPRLPRAA